MIRNQSYILSPEISSVPREEIEKECGRDTRQAHHVQSSPGLTVSLPSSFPCECIRKKVKRVHGEENEGN